MSEDYLWDRSGPPDPDIERLEHVLRPLRAGPAAPPRWPLPVHESVRPAVPIWFQLAAAALLLACAAGAWAVHASRPSWTVVRVAGTPAIGHTPVHESGRLRLGQWLETDAESRASVEIADIGRVDVGGDTKLRLTASREGHHALALRRGSLHALVWAPPGQFFVETPSSTTVDLGCEYTLRVDDSGAGLVEVLTGWVGFEYAGRESFIPAGARCATRPRVGPGTPYFADVSEPVRAALEVLDFGHADYAARRAALDVVLAAARPRDAITLWHMLARIEPEDRDRVYDALARFVPAPASVTREGIRRGDRAMTDAWWNALGLGTTDWWRTWKRSWN